MFWDVTKSRLKSWYILKSENIEFVFPLSLHPPLYCLVQLFTKWENLSLRKMQEINFSNKNGLWCKGKVKMTLAHHTSKYDHVYQIVMIVCHSYSYDVVRRKLKTFHARERWQLTFHTKFVSQIHPEI